MPNNLEAKILHLKLAVVTTRNNNSPFQKKMSSLVRYLAFVVSLSTECQNVKTKKMSSELRLP